MAKVFYLAMFLRYVSMLDYDPVSLLKTINVNYSFWLLLDERAPAYIHWYSVASSKIKKLLKFNFAEFKV